MIGVGAGFVNVAFMNDYDYDEGNMYMHTCLLLLKMILYVNASALHFA